MSRRIASRSMSTALGLSILITLLASLPDAKAEFFSASQGNWTMALDTERFDEFSAAGLNSWTNNNTGFNHLFEQWTWFRIGDTGPERPIDALTFVSASNPAANQIEVIYGQAGTDDIQVKTIYTLLEDTPNRPNISKSILVSNLTTQNLDVTLFEYTDLDLDGDPFDLDARLFESSPGAKDEVIQTDFNFVQAFANGIVDHYQIGPFDSIRESLNNDSTTTLSDTAATLGPGDAVFAFQYAPLSLTPGIQDGINFELDGSFEENPPGFSQGDPFLPDNQDGGGFGFDDARSGRWFDPPTVSGYEFDITSTGDLFTTILDFPTGFDQPFEVLVDGISLGIFSPGESVFFGDFFDELGDLLIGSFGVESFVIQGIAPLTDPANPTAFPIQLGFSNSVVNFTMTPLIPEPTTATLLSVLSLIALSRPDRRACHIG